MRVHFVEPPPQQRVGGLDAAIRSLESALRECGVSVDGALPRNGDPAEDVVHFHGLWQPAHARLARDCRARGIRYLVSSHGMLEPWAWRHRWWKKWPYFQFIERRFLRGAACLLATAETEAARLRQLLPGQRVEAIPLGLTGTARPDYDRARMALGWAPEEHVLLFLSRLHIKKGLDLLLRALATVQSPAATRLVIVGGGDRAYVTQLRALAADLAPHLPRIDWTGEIWGKARWQYFQGADLFCLPTHSENFGLAVLEACSVGTPVLTTTATPWPDALTGQPAYLCTPTVESITEALRRFFFDGKTATPLRMEFASWAHHTFAWNQLAPRYLELYRTVLGQPSDDVEP